MIKHFDNEVAAHMLQTGYNKYDVIRAIHTASPAAFIDQYSTKTYAKFVVENALKDPKVQQTLKQQSKSQGR